MSAISNLDISPKELRFRFEPRRQIPASLTLENRTSTPMAFKVKTTAPKKYCVKPSSGMVGPQSSLPVQVLMQAQKEPPSDMADCKDKFLVQSTPCALDWDVNKATDLFDKSKNLKLTEEKLKVILEGPAAPPSPVPEMPEGQEGAPMNVPSSLPTSTRGFTSDKTLSDENRKLKEKLALMELQGHVDPSKSRGFTMLHVILMAILAFLLGYFV